MIAKHSGEWKSWKEYPYVKSSGNWEQSKSVWIKIDEEWKQLVPPNVIMLYNTIPDFGLICDGDNDETPNLLGKFISISRSAATGAVGGSASHSGSGHGDASMTSSSRGGTRFYNPKGVYSTTGLARNNPVHTHTAPAHTHTSCGSNIPRYKNLIPIIRNPFIQKDAIIVGDTTWRFDSKYFSNGSVKVENYNSYIRLDNNNSTGGNTSHTHSYNSSLTSRSYTTSTSEITKNDDDWYRKHEHIIPSHNMMASNNLPAYKNFKAVKTNKVLFFNELPKNTIAFLALTDNNIPEGWSERSYFNRLLRISNETSFGPVGNTHDHPTSGYVKTSTSYNYEGTVKKASSGSTFSRWYMTSHTHVFKDHHDGSVSCEPPWVKLKIIIKD